MSKRGNQSKTEEELSVLEAELRAQPLVLPDRRYSVVVLDPPWPMRKIVRRVAPKQFGFDYPTMTLEEIQALPIPQLLERNAWVFMWVVQKQMPRAYELLSNWGLTYRYTMTWMKNGGFQIYNYPQFNTEHVLCGSVGKPVLADQKAFSTGFTGKRRAHSEKPEEFYDLIRRTCGEGAKLDMFNRREIEGFDRWGNEA